MPAHSSTRCSRAGGDDVAPEAVAAAAAFRAVQGDVGAALRACASGRELIDAGYPDDVEIAAELDRSASVPVLRDGAFRGESAASAGLDVAPARGVDGVPAGAGVPRPATRAARPTS